MIEGVIDTGLTRALGFRLSEAGPDRVVLSWTTGPEHRQPHGIVHGGVYCSAAEASASIGGALWYGERGKVVGTANHTSFLRPVREGQVVATATPVQRGRTQQIWQVDMRDENHRLVARSEVRLQNLPE